MSINTTLITGHTIIVDPENPAEVGKVIRSGGGDVGYVCSRGNLINMFAKYKPVKKANVTDTAYDLKGGTGSDKNQWKSTATWYRGDESNATSYIETGTPSGYVMSTSCGITLKGYFGLLRYLVDNWDANGWRHYWTYNPPTGGLAAPYRLIDFNYYDRDAAAPFRDFQAPAEIIRYRYGDEYVITGQASVKWPAGSTAYQLTMDDIYIKQGAGKEVLKNYYFGVVMAKIKSGDTDLTPGNRTYGIITAAQKWSETVEPADAAPQDIRYTQPFTPDFFLGSSFGSVFRMYPVLSKEKFDSITGMDYSGTVPGGVDNPIYPLPFDPIDCLYHDQEAAIQLSVTITRTGTGYLRLNLTATNLTNTQQVLNLSLVTFWFVVYPKDANHSTQYDQPTYFPSDAQTGGSFTWVDSSSRTEITIPANGTATSIMNNVGYTDNNYGCFIQLKMDYPYGVVTAGGASYDYDL